MALKVEWGSSIVLEFTTQHLSPITHEWETVDADSYEAYLETAEKAPQQLRELNVQPVDTGKYHVVFYADKQNTMPGETYYVAFYWQKDEIKMAERELVIVVPDVRKT